MRGIGVGILFSTMVYFIAGNEKPQMTDEQIIQAAKELGMEEKKAVDLSGLIPTPTIVPAENKDSTKEDSVSNNGKEDTTEKSKVPSTAPELEENGASPNTGDDTSNDVSNSNHDEGIAKESEEIVTLVISKGMYSHDVAGLCESIGLVENAKEFDNYLIRNGHSSSIRINRYEIPVGASFEEIARLITARPRY